MVLAQLHCITLFSFPRNEKYIFYDSFNIIFVNFQVRIQKLCVLKIKYKLRNEVMYAMKKCVIFHLVFYSNSSKTVQIIVMEPKKQNKKITKPKKRYSNWRVNCDVIITENIWLVRMRSAALTVMTLMNTLRSSNHELIHQ